MVTNIFGGIPVIELDRKVLLENATTKRTTLGQSPYKYELASISPMCSYEIQLKARYCIYVLDVEKGSVRINGVIVNPHSYALGDATSINIEIADGTANLLVAYQGVEALAIPLDVKKVSEAKRVEKPWGYEVWLTGDPSTVFAFKKIHLRAGNKTSLQYHQQKRETNFVLSGKAAFHYNPDHQIPPYEFLAQNTKSEILTGPFVADVFPNLIHRLEAIEDLLLYEVSTPELDDVIRISDDAARVSGRIMSEHDKRMT